MGQPIWMKGDGASVTLTLHIQPGASRTEAVGLHGEALKLRLAAPPVDGKANACLLAFFADFLGCPKSAVELVAGATSRQKRVRITQLTAASRTKLEQLGSPGAV